MSQEKKNTCIVRTPALLRDHNNRRNDTKSSTDRYGTTIRILLSPVQGKGKVVSVLNYLSTTL
jgi:hypothetical protein